MSEQGSAFLGGDVDAMGIESRYTLPVQVRAACLERERDDWQQYMQGRRDHRHLEQVQPHLRGRMAPFTSSAPSAQASLNPGTGQGDLVSPVTHLRHQAASSVESLRCTTHPCC